MTEIQTIDILPFPSEGPVRPLFFSKTCSFQSRANTYWCHQLIKFSRFHALSTNAFFCENSVRGVVYLKLCKVSFPLSLYIRFLYVSSRQFFNAKLPLSWPPKLMSVFVPLGCWYDYARVTLSSFHPGCLFTGLPVEAHLSQQWGAQTWI